MRFLRPAWPDCSLLSVTRLNGVPAQGESPAPPWCQKRAGSYEPCDEVCRNRAGRVSSRCNVTKSSLATFQVRRQLARALIFRKGLGLESTNVLFAVYSRPQNKFSHFRQTSRKHDTGGTRVTIRRQLPIVRPRAAGTQQTGGDPPAGVPGSGGLNPRGPTFWSVPIRKSDGYTCTGAARRHEGDARIDVV